MRVYIENAQASVDEEKLRITCSSILSHTLCTGIPCEVCPFDERSLSPKDVIRTMFALLEENIELKVEDNKECM